MLPIHSIFRLYGFQQSFIRILIFFVAHFKSTQSTPDQMPIITVQTLHSSAGFLFCFVFCLIIRQYNQLVFSLF